MTRIEWNIPLFFVYTAAHQARFGRAVFTLFLADRGLSWIEIGALQSVLYLSNFVTEVPTGVFGDRFGRRVSVACGLLLTALVSFGQLAFSSFWAFLMLFVAQGLAFSLVSGSDSALFYDSIRAVGRSDDYVRLRSRVQVTGACAMACAMVVGGWLATGSWTPVYVGSALASLAALAAVVAMQEPAAEPSDEPTDGVLASLHAFVTRAPGRTLLPLALASACLHGAMTPYFVFSQSAFAGEGIPIAWIATVFAVVEVASGIVGLSSGRVAGLFALPTTVRVVLCTITLCLLASATRSGVLGVGLFLVANSVLAVLVILIDDHLQARVPSAIRASVLSTYSFLEACATGGSYFVGGLLVDRLGPDVGIASFAALTVAALVLASVYFARSPIANP